MSSSNARFRYRTASGEEVEIASVDQLSQRIASGDIREDTPLYDAGTGQWIQAGEAPVFRFILEELDHDGSEGGHPGSDATSDPHGTEVAGPSEGSPAAGAAGAAGGEADDRGDGAPVDDEAELPLIPDPFGPEAERTPRPPAAPEEPPAREAPPKETPADGGRGDGGPADKGRADEGEAGEGRADRGPAEEAPSTPPEDDTFGPIHFGDPTPSRDPGTRASPPPGDAAPSEPRLTRRSPAEEMMDRSRARERAAPPARESSPPRRAPRDAEAVEGFETELAGGLPGGGGTVGPADPGPIRSRPPPGSEGRTRGRVRRRQGVEVPFPVLLASIVALLALGAGGWWLISGAGASGDADTSGPTATPQPTTQPTPEAGSGPASQPFPTDLNGLLSGLMENELDRLADSVRTESGVPAAPPPEWLSGRYLSGASDYGEVAEFWASYADFMEVFLASDSTLYVEAARRILEADPDDPSAEEIAPSTDQLPDDLDVPALLARVEERYSFVAEERTDRLVQLRETAHAALRLHEFLEANEDRIEYSPVMGQAVSRDPILEAVPDAPELRRELEGHLDDVFRSLDRSRQGGPPSPAGLRVELFERFSRPL